MTGHGLLGAGPVTGIRCKVLAHHNSKRESCKVEFRHYNHAFASLAFCSPTLRLGLPTLPGGLSSLATDSQYLPDTMLELPRDNLLRH